jgi:WD40 repeat protein
MSNGRKALTWSNDGSVCIWREGELSLRFQQDPGVVQAVLSPDEKRLVAICDDFTARLWSVDDGRMLGECIHDGWVGGAAFQSNGNVFFTWSDDSTARRWNATTATQLGDAYRMAGALNGAVYLPRRALLLTWATDGSLQQWRDDRPEKVGRLLRHQDAVIGATYIGEGREILSWGADDTARLWDAGSGAQLIPPLTHKAWVFGAHLRKKQLLTWSFDNTAALWDAASGKRLQTLHHRSLGLQADAGVFLGAFLNDSTAITAGADGELRLWRLPGSDQPLAVLAHQRPAEASPQQYLPGFIQLRQSGLLITWNGDKAVKLWKETPKPDLSTVSPGAIPALLIKATGLRLSEDGEQLVSVVE